MDATLRASVSRPLEVLHRVCEVHVIAVNPDCVKRTIEQFAGRSDEVVSLFVLDVARLFPDKHDACAARTLTKNSLCSALEQIAPATSLRCRAKLC